jgi:cytoskeleton protein RodZ
MPQGSPARTVGARLREAREKRGVSLRQIASRTRISVMSLEALERSDLSRLPGGIFTRAFVRAYAEEVGLDPERTIEDFIAELPPEAATATAHSTSVEDGEKLESDRRAVATALRLALVSLPIIGLVLYYGSRSTPAAPAPSLEGATDSHTAPSAAPVESSVPAATAARPPDAVAAAGSAPQVSGLSMELAPKATCWVSVTTDGELAFSGVMNAGERRLVTAREQIALNIGDAGVFAYTLNGRPGRSLGGPGKVVSARITPANLHEFLTP